MFGLVIGKETKMDTDVQKVLDELENNTLAYSRHIYDALVLLEPEQRSIDLVTGIDQMIWGILIQPNFSAFEYGMLCAYLTMRLVSAAGVYTFKETLGHLRLIMITYISLAQHKPLPPEAEDALSYYRDFANLRRGD